MVAFALVLGATSALCAPSGADECSETCPGDSPQGECLPFCDYCACCVSMGVFVDPAVAVLLTFQTRQLLPTDSLDGPELASPIDIFHVPKSFLT